MRTALLVTIIALAGVAGCSGHPYATADRLDNGLVIVLSPGLSQQDNSICQYLVEDGVDWAIETYLSDALSPIGSIILSGVYVAGQLPVRDAFVHEGAILAAKRIVEYQESYPGRPVVLVTQGLCGGQIGIDAVSSLDDSHIDGLIMVFPDVVNDTALDEALSHSRRGIVNLFLTGDYLRWSLLSRSPFVSFDMNQRPTAGTDGFQLPSDTSRLALYSKLYQIVLAARVVDEGGGQEDYVVKPYHEYITPFITSDDWATTAQLMRQTQAEAPTASDLP